MARRPQQVRHRDPLTHEQISKACYVGSSEHKTTRWWGGLPGAYVNSDGIATRPKKQQKSICPLTTEAQRQQATHWVQAALCASQMKYREGDKVFPAHIWYCDQGTGQLWRGRCINSISGEYKGWPIDEDERIEVFDRMA